MNDCKRNDVLLQKFVSDINGRSYIDQTTDCLSKHFIFARKQAPAE